MKYSETTKNMTLSRRELAVKSALGFASLPLRSLITGLPASFLLGLSSPSSAATVSDKKFLIISHWGGADPVGENAPGSYPLDPDDLSDPLHSIEHPSVAEAGDVALGYENPVMFKLGEQKVRAAQIWADLDEDLRSNMGFWHHSTLTTSHPDFANVRRFHGAIKNADGRGSSELDELIAQETAQSLGTLVKEPISLGGSRIVYEGCSQPILAPTSIKNLFASSEVNLDKMVKLRDGFIDEVYKKVKKSGTPAQKSFLDNYARSQSEASNMGDGLGALLTGVSDDSGIGQAKVAAALVQLNICPVVTVGFRFGGDNHGDSQLTDEAEASIAGAQSINTLWGELKAANLQDRVIVSSLNTFGRTKLRNTEGGRDHNGDHHTMFTVGTNIKGGMIGGMEPIYQKGKIKDFKASAINSVTGKSKNSDIEFDETLVSMGKTLAKAVGIDDSVIDKRFDGGKVITAAFS